MRLGVSAGLLGSQKRNGWADGGEGKQAGTPFILPLSMCSISTKGVVQIKSVPSSHKVLIRGMRLQPQDPDYKCALHIWIINHSIYHQGDNQEEPSRSDYNLQRSVSSDPLQTASPHFL